MQATAQVIPFRFETREVRTMLIDDQPWFVASDVCATLSIVNTARAMSRLDDDEKGIHTVNTRGGTQNVGILNESGLYSLILTSRKEEAKRFKKWITAEVLPAIRKHGRYHDEQGKMATLIGETIGTDGFHMLGALIKGKVAGLPAANQRKAKAKIWSQTHAAFGVRSAADIPASQLDSARNFIAAYALEGEWLPKDARPKILSREHRVLGYLDLNGVERWEDIAAGAYILTRREFIDSMLVHCDMPVTTDEMFEFAQLALANLNSRSNCMAAQLKAFRKRA